jgi:hypothetical protein
MERYAQMGFTPKQRDEIFGERDWGQFELRNFNELSGKLGGNGDNKIIARTLDDIIKLDNGLIEKNNKVNELSERFNAVINFPNFLLHVLRVVSKKDIPLDDKRLLTIFEEHLIKNDNCIEMVREFTFGLLKCKYLFDQFVIKREYLTETDGWSLKRFKWNDGVSYVNTFNDDAKNDDDNGGKNRRILMLLAAFHVSAPTMVYKHWLNAALYYLYYAEKLSAVSYLSHLESVAKAFVFDRFLAPKDRAEYFSMIYTNEGVCKTKRNNISDDCLQNLLSFDQIENNFIFNYLDYLLWIKYEKKNILIKIYEFTFRSSVEHYYPQHPFDGFDRLPSETLNSFGNLCLISHSKNSRLSNYMPADKKEHYKNNNIDSIKQHLMMSNDSQLWNGDSIAEHYEKMKNVLLEALASPP